MQLLCGQCGKTLEVNEAKSGPTVQCPKCGHVIPVPFFGGDDQQPPPAGPDDGGFLPSSIKKTANGTGAQKVEKPPAQPSAAAARTPEPAKAEQPPQEEGFADQARKASFKKINVKCAACQKELSVGYRLAGKKARCPKCGKSIEIPYPDNVDKLELEILKKAAAVETEVLTMTAEDYDEQVPQETKAAAPVTTAAATRTTTPWIKTSKARMTIITGVLGLAIVIGMLIVLSNMGQPGEDKGTGSGSANSASTVRQTYADPSTASPGELPSPDTTQIQQPVTPIKPVRQPAKPALAVKAASADEFAGPTFLPAMPGMTYWYVSLEIKAGDHVLRFPNFGPGIALKIGNDTYASLGSPLPGAMLPRPAGPAKLEVPPLAKQELTVIFEVPRSTDKAVIEIAGIGQCDVTCKPAAFDAKLEGQYSVLQFRNMRPVPHNSVLQTLQETSKQTLVLKPSGGNFDLTIPEAELRGLARPSGKPGIYDLTMTNGSETLENCQISLSDGGDMLTIYTSPDSRFGSLCYLREGKNLRQPPELAPIAPARLSSVQPKPKPKDPEPPPKTRTIFDP